MRLSLATAAVLFATGTALAPIASMAQATNTPATTPSAAPSVAPTPAAPATTTPSTPTTTAGAQTPAASVNTTPQTTSPSPSSVQTQNTTRRTAAAPVAGRNSFTMNQAVRRITAAGYTKVAGLKKDGQGIWRGQAQKDGNPVTVSLDYQGNVTGQ